MEIKLHYQEKGEGEPMILLHGNGEDGSYLHIKWTISAGIIV